MGKSHVVPVEATFQPAVHYEESAQDGSACSRGVICIGLRLRGEVEGDQSTALQRIASDIAAFLNEYFPELSVEARPHSVTLICPGPPTHLMNIADAVIWHLGCLGRWEGSLPFDAQVGVAVAIDGVSAPDLLSRAEAAAQCPILRGPKRSARTDHVPHGW
ncbi:hypothetical protein [Occultella kanbiaonis]|uniref:hypothetical protein n=1 Tax=Occultella kanbiaonis TaxID=2675754 RepID=UPI0012B87D95|nr:hypothetical protein [Occultella kanbiaonis]